MKVSNRRGAPRTALFLVVGALAVLGGCGSDDDGDADRDGSAAAQSESRGTSAEETGGGSTAGADEQQIRDLFARMGKAIATRDAKTACPLMAKSAQRTFVMLASSGSGPKTCEHGFAVAFKDGTQEARNPKLVRVDLQGPRATVYARASTSKQLERAPFVKEGDRWKVESWLTD